MQEEAEQVEERMQSYNNQSVWRRNDAGQNPLLGARWQLYVVGEPCLSRVSEMTGERVVVGGNYQSLENTLACCCAAGLYLPYMVFGNLV